MDEAGYWSTRVRPLLTRECQAAGHRFHLERIENVVAGGTPDVDYLIAGVAGKIELKYAPRHPMHDTTQVLGLRHGMRRSQIVYAARHVWAGGMCWCLIGTPDADWLLDLRTMTPEAMAAIGTLCPAELRKISAWRHEGRWVAPTPLAAVLKGLGALPSASQLG
jgi:hypothetical protein